MFRIIKWLFFCFVFVLLWQISRIIDDNREQIGKATLRLSDDFEKSTHEVIKQGRENIQNVQQNLADSVKLTSKQYIEKIMK